MNNQELETYNLSHAIKETVKLSLPLIGFRMVGSINGFLTMLLIAMLGQKELAASALITPIQLTLNFIGWSVIFAVSVVVGKAFGQKKYSDLGQIFRQGCLIGIVLGIPTTILFWYVGPLLRLFGQDESLIELIQPYFQILAFGILPGMFYCNFIQFVSDIGKPRIVLYVSLINIVLVVLPSYLLMFGKLGLPKLGMLAVAYLTSAVFYVACLMALLFLLKSPYYRQFQIFKFSKDRNFFYFRKIFQIGIPMSVQFISELSAFAFATIMVGWINQISLAASQIINQVNMIMLMGPFGIGHASSVLVSQAVGRSDKSLTRNYANAGLLFGLIFCMVVMMIYLIFSHQLIKLFSIDVTNPANVRLIHIAITLFVIVAFSQIFDGLRNIATGVLRGFHDSIQPMWVGVVASWIIGIPLGYCLGIKLHWGAAGISSGFLIAWIFGTAILINRMYRKAERFLQKT